MVNKKYQDSSYIVVDAGDFHFGAGDDVKLGKAYEENFNGFLEANGEVIDLVVISGDLCHKELKFSSESARIMLGCLSHTIAICEKYNIQLRLLKGTATHDRNQVETLGIIFNDKEIFKAISTVTEEEVFPGFNVLYIPEEYPADMREYYKEKIFEAQSQHYDFVFFHGTMEFQSFQSSLFESELNIESAPVFRCADMMRICKGPITGGHIHTACDYKKKIFYHGSFSRNAQGEPNAKGFNYYQYFQDEVKFEYTFVENPDAPIYKTLDVETIFTDYSGNTENALKEIATITADENVNFRLFVGASFAKEYPEVKRIITDLAAGKKNLTPMFAKDKTLASESKTEVSETDLPQEEESELSFLNDQGIEISEKLRRFSKLKFNVDLKLEDVQMAIVE